MKGVDFNQRIQRMRAALSPISEKLNNRSSRNISSALGLIMLAALSVSCTPEQSVAAVATGLKCLVGIVVFGSLLAFANSIN